MNVKSTLLIIISFLVIGCNSTNQPSLVTSFIPSLTQAELLETTPTSSLVSSSINNQTVTMTVMPTMSPARATQESLINNFSSVCQNPFLYGMELSPNKEWITVECSDNRGPYIKIVRIDKQVEWELYYLDIYGSKQDSIDGNMTVSHWTQDGNYAYVTVFPQMDGVGFAFFEAAALYRLDLNSGELTETLPGGNASRKYYSLGFSPNDRRLAYFDLSSQFVSLLIHDFQTVDDQFISLNSKYNTGGEFIWADNSQLLVFCAAYFDINTNDYSDSTIFLWDNEQKTLRKLVDNFEEVLVPVNWNGESKIILEGRFSTDEVKYEYDLDSGTLTPIK